MIKGNEWYNWAIQNVPNEPRTAQGYRNMLAYTKVTNPISASGFLENFLYVYRDEWKPTSPVWEKNWINDEIAWMENAKNEYDSMLMEKQKIQDEEEERLLKIKLENQKLQNEIKRKLIIPQITPTVIATSSLIPLGIIGLLLYSRTGRK